MTGNDGADKDNSAMHLKDASDSLFETITSLNDTIDATYRFLWTWFGNHPIIRWVVLLPVTYGLSQALLNAFSLLYAYFFGRNVMISRDVSVQTHPLPLGLSLNIMFLVLLLIVIAGQYRIVTLRQRVEKLENELR